jgi:hypothetical protein
LRRGGPGEGKEGNGDPLDHGREIIRPLR